MIGSLRRTVGPAFILGFLGAVQFAAADPDISKLTPYKTFVVNFINNIAVPVLVAIAFIIFLIGVFKYFIKGGADPKSREEGRQFVLWGIIGFVVIFSVWGLVKLVYEVLGFSAGSAPTVPTFPTT